MNNHLASFSRPSPGCVPFTTTSRCHTRSRPRPSCSNASGESKETAASDAADVSRKLRRRRSKSCSSLVRSLERGRRFCHSQQNTGRELRQRRSRRPHATIPAGRSQPLRHARSLRRGGSGRRGFKSGRVIGSARAPADKSSAAPTKVRLLITSSPLRLLLRTADSPATAEQLLACGEPTWSSDTSLLPFTDSEPTFERPRCGRAPPPPERLRPMASWREGKPCPPCRATRGGSSEVG